MAAIAMLPLFSVLYMLVVRGAPLLSLELFTELTPGAGAIGGGISNALLGTVVVVTLATLLSLPLGFLAAVYLAEYGGETKLASTVRFAGKVLAGMPSILAGVFAGLERRTQGSPCGLPIAAHASSTLTLQLRRELDDSLAPT